MAALHFSVTKALAQLTWIAQTTRDLCFVVADDDDESGKFLYAQNDFAHLRFSSGKSNIFPILKLYLGRKLHIDGVKKISSLGVKLWWSNFYKILDKICKVMYMHLFRILDFSRVCCDEFELFICVHSNCIL